MIAEVGRLAIVIHWKSRLSIIPIELVVQKLICKLVVSTQHDSICPRWSSVLSTCVIHIAIFVKSISWIKSDWAFNVVFEDLVLLMDLAKLIMREQSTSVSLFDQVLGFLCRQVYSPVHISKEAFVVMEALFLRQTETEFIKRIIIDLSNVLKSFSYLVLAGFKVDVNKRKRSVIQIKPNSHRSFVPRHARESSLDLALLDVFESVFKLLFGEHYYVLAYHDFPGNKDVFWTKCVLKHLLPQLGTSLIFAHNHGARIQWHHLLTSKNVEVGLFHAFGEDDVVNFVLRRGRRATTTIPRNNCERHLVLVRVDLAVS